ncbi:MAG: PAS domain-containing protein [Kiritimatiellae bacterium]|nr:PAS domain-containing protein [Kiritimatiellia bacterium]
MKSFFSGVRRHIGSLDASHLREQYSRLAEEADSLETLFETMADGIVVLDGTGAVVKSNAAAKELLGMDPATALRGWQAPAAGAAAKREIEITYPEKRTLEIRTVPLRERTLLYLRDVTAERERTREELQEGATKAVRDLAAAVAHEIGNPLNAISLNLQLARRAGAAVEEIDECLRQTRRLSGILDSFLAVMRPSRPNLAPGSLADPVKNCIASMKPLFEERGIALTLDLPGALPAVAIDSQKMEQVFFNLFKNALEAVKDGGRIDISITSDDNDAVARVADNGIGMDATEVSRLFEPYRTSKTRGTGLGLMVCSRIVRDHGGSISVMSRKGEGTVFTIRLPRIERRIRELGETGGRKEGEA